MVKMKKRLVKKVFKNPERHTKKQIKTADKINTRKLKKIRIDWDRL